MESGEKDHGRLGTYFTNTVIPQDFRKLFEGPASLTIEVDEASAIYPWEMIAQTRFAKTSFVSHNIALSHLIPLAASTPPPTSPPARAIGSSSSCRSIRRRACSRWRVRAREEFAVVDVRWRRRVSRGATATTSPLRSASAPAATRRPSRF